MVWGGLISYPHYLWHWPLLVYFAMIKTASLTEIERGLVISLSLLLAWVTYRFIEFQSGSAAANHSRPAA